MRAIGCSAECQVNLVCPPFGERWQAEAAGVIETAIALEPGIADRVDVVALKGAAAYMQGHYDEAETAFNDPRFDQDPGYALWRAAVAAGRERHQQVGEYASGGVKVPADFPEALRVRMLVQIGQSALTSGRLEIGREILDNLSSMNLSPSDRAMTDYLSGLADKAAGNPEAAIQRWRAIADQGIDRKVSVLARLAQIQTEVDTGAITPADGAAAIDKLRFDWRGDEIELLVVLQTGWAHLAEELLAKIFRTMLLEVAPASCSQKGGESTLSFACLALACRSWHQAVLAVAVRRWVPHGLKGLNARDAAGHTPLHHATKAGDANGVRGLLAAKSSVDAADPRGERRRIQRAEE